MVLPIPAVVFGKVAGRFVVAIGDTADADNLPDFIPATGVITFAAKNPIVKTTDPLVVIKSAIPCGLDNEGYLLDPAGNRGVWPVRIGPKQPETSGSVKPAQSA